MYHLAVQLHVFAQVRQLNMYREGDVTHFGQTLVDFYMEKCWSQVLDRSSFSSRKEAVLEFNKKNRWRKRGICAIPTKYGISFTYFPLNQSGALVHVYQDGQVLLSHGGTEMGQGLFTKMIQVWYLDMCCAPLLSEFQHTGEEIF